MNDSVIVVCFLLMLAPGASQAAWQAGLQGGTVSSTTMNTTAYPAVTNVYMGPHAGKTQSKPPWADNLVWIYWGQIHLDAGTVWFAENIDDAVNVRIWNGATPVTLINNAIWNTPTCGSFTAPEAGWYPIEIRLQNGTGGAGPVVGSNWTATHGFGFKIGGASSTSGTDYVYPEDDGSQSLFRYDDGTGFFLAKPAQAVWATSATLCGFDASPAEGDVFTVFWGTSDHGQDAAAWEADGGSATLAVSELIDEANLRYPLTNLVHLTTYFYTFRKTAADETTEWSPDPASFTTRNLAALAVVDAAFTSVDLECRVLSYGAGFDAIEGTLEVASDETFTNVVKTLGLGTLSGEVGMLATNTVTGLAPATAYHARFLVTNLSNCATSAPVAFATIDKPFTFTPELLYTDNGDGTFTLRNVIENVYDGVTLSVTLGINDDDDVSTQTFTSAGTFSYTGAFTEADAVLLTYTAVVGGETYTRTLGKAVTLFVATTGDDANTGYTPAQAKATVSAALNAATEDIEHIYILPGKHVIEQELVVSKPLTISGYNTSDPADVVITNSSGTSRVMTISNADAVVIGLTLSGGNGAGSGGGVYIATGLLSNSVVVANKATSTGNGVYMANNANAVLMDCLVTDNVSSARGGGGGISCAGTQPRIYRTIIQRNNIGGNYHKGGGVLGGTLYDCEIIDNKADAVGIIYGAGAADSILYRCKVLRNTCPYDAAGLYRCTAYDCLIMDNRSTGKVVSGAAGVDGGACYNCTIVGNIPSSAAYGGVTGATLYNCIVAGNATLAGVTNNYTSGTFNYTCVSPLPGLGTGNIDVDPKLNADGTLGTSPCVNKGSSAVAYFPNEAARATDLAGDARIALGRLDMGCYEKQETEALDLSLDLDKTPEAGTAGVAVVCRASATADAGATISVTWTFGDGTTATSTHTGTGAAAEITLSHTYVYGGAYTVSAVATVTDGVGATEVSDTAKNKFRIAGTEGRDLFVSTTGSDANDGFGWATAKATPFSAAVGVLAGYKIHIAAGEYLVDEEIAVNKAVEVIGEGAGPESVVLTGNGYCRVLNVSAAAVVRGLTVRNGRAAYGAGAFLQAGTITNCVFTGNTATGNYNGNNYTAAGVFMLNSTAARVTHCVFTNNTGCANVYGGVVASPINDGKAVVADCRFIKNKMSGANAGGLAFRVTLKNCVFEYNAFSIQNLYGGCARECVVYRSIFRYNSIGWNGAGVAVDSSTVYDSLIHDNTLGASTRGAACAGTLYNCTIVNNVATQTGYLAGVCRGTWWNDGGTLYNCILWGNTNTTDKTVSNHNGATLNYCVSSPVVAGGTSRNADPLLKRNYSPGAGSPCVDAGLAKNPDGSLNATYFPQAAHRELDLAGAPRIMRTQIDIGCYELSRFPTVLVVR